MSGGGESGGTEKAWLGFFDRMPLFARPPGRLFHVLMAVPTAVALWACSVPGIHYFPFVAGGWLILFGAVVWGARGLTYLAARWRATARGSAWWFTIAPAAGVVVLGLLVADVPLRVRWAFAHDDFAQAAELAPAPSPTGESVPFDVPRRVGGYAISQAVRVGDAVLFYEATGALFDDAGFAYVPNGRAEELSIHVAVRELRSLGDDWYAFTATW